MIAAVLLTRIGVNIPGLIAANGRGEAIYEASEENPDDFEYSGDNTATGVVNWYQGVWHKT